jgi:hypothetical protein
MDYAALASISAGYSPLQGRFQRITHPFAARLVASLDLHVLSLPPMFALSQDQTLNLMWFTKGKLQAGPMHLTTLYRFHSTRLIVRLYVFFG